LPTLSENLRTEKIIKFKIGMISTFVIERLALGIE